MKNDAEGVFHVYAETRKYSHVFTRFQTPLQPQSPPIGRNRCIFGRFPGRAGSKRGAGQVAFFRAPYQEESVGMTKGHRGVDGARSLSQPRYSDYKLTIVCNNFNSEFSGVPSWHLYEYPTWMFL